MHRPFNGKQGDDVVQEEQFNTSALKAAFVFSSSHCVKTHLNAPDQHNFQKGLLLQMLTHVLIVHQGQRVGCTQIQITLFSLSLGT